MSDRLTDLRRQRALAREQVAWFDREIAREEGSTERDLKPTATAASAPAALATPASTPAEPAVDQQADQIIEQYRDQGRSIQSEVRRGCFLYFGAAFALLAAAAVLFYVIRHRESTDEPADPAADQAPPSLSTPDTK